MRQHDTLFYFLHRIALGCLLFSISFSVGAQTIELKVDLPQPEWHQKTMCKTNGLQLNAPSVSLSFSIDPNKIKDSRYDYKWEQQIERGNWVVVTEEKNAIILPAFKLDGIQNKTSKPQLYSWRVSVRDIANGTSWVNSEPYSLTIVPFLTANFTVTREENKPTYAVDLNLTGGDGKKKIQWSGSVPLTESQKNAEHNQGLKPGDYKVYITDECGSISIPIQIKPNQP